MPDGLELNFALIETDGKQELVAVTSSRSENQFDLYEGSALEALLELAQDEKGGLVIVAEGILDPLLAISLIIRKIQLLVIKSSLSTF